MDTIKVVAYAQATPATGMPCPTRRSRTFTGVEIDLDGGVTARVVDGAGVDLGDGHGSGG